MGIQNLTNGVNEFTEGIKHINIYTFCCAYYFPGRSENEPTGSGLVGVFITFMQQIYWRVKPVLLGVEHLWEEWPTAADRRRFAAESREGRNFHRSMRERAPVGQKKY